MSDALDRERLQELEARIDSLNATVGELQLEGGLSAVSQSQLAVPWESLIRERDELRSKLEENSSE